MGFVHSLPLKCKFDEQTDKQILRQVATKYMPRSYARLEKNVYQCASQFANTGALAGIISKLLSGS